MTLQDFAQGKGWVGISPSRLLCPDPGVCVLLAEVGSIRVGAGCQGELRIGKRRQEGSGIGGAAPPFLSVPGKFISSAPLQARQVALLTLSPPTPKCPRVQACNAGYWLRPLCCRLELALGLGKSSWGVVAATVCVEREVAPGDLGRLGWQARLRVER